MPTTRKKTIKTIYKDEDDSEADAGDFSDSGSDAVIPHSCSEDDEETETHNSSDEYQKKNRSSKAKPVKKPKYSKTFIAKVSQRTISNAYNESDSDTKIEPTFSVKDLTDADKLLPSFLNLSESDSSDEEEAPKMTSKSLVTQIIKPDNEESELETCTEYKDVWTKNLEQSEEIAKKTFSELEKHKSRLEETKESIHKYTIKNEKIRESDVNDLLALGEEILPPVSPPKIKKRRGAKTRNDSDSEMEDWEEVAEGKILPQQGLQLIVDFPDAVSRKTKKLDVEMMMKRKINRVKKEYQVYMHKVHVLCWLGHGNYVSQVLNDQDIMKAAISIVPSETCYPGERVDMKYVEGITTWFKDKFVIKCDKNEGKFRPKAPPIKDILLQQIKSKVVTSKKNFVFIFVSMLRAIGLHCRIMLNFTTLPLKPPSTELCSLSTKPKTNKSNKEDKQIKESKKKTVKKNADCKKIPQLDGIYDSLSDSDLDNIMQIDGNDDAPATKQKKSPLKGRNKIENKIVEDVSPPKRPRRNLSIKKSGLDSSNNFEASNKNIAVSNANEKTDLKNEPVQIVTRKSLSLKRKVENLENKNTNDGKTVKGMVENDKTSASMVPKTTRRSLTLKKNVKKTDIKNLSLCKGESSKKDEMEHNANLESKTQPKIIVTNIDNVANISSEYFEAGESRSKREIRARKRSHTSNPLEIQNNKTNDKESKNSRAKSAPGTAVNKSKYFKDNKSNENSNATKKVTSAKKIKVSEKEDEDCKRINHRDLVKTKTKPKSDVTNELISIIKKRVREAMIENKTGKNKKSSDEDSDYLPEISEEQASTSRKSNVKSGKSRKIDRRVLSTDDEAPSRKMDTWCEIFVEELEQWVAVDVVKGRVHCVNEIYSGATHPVNYVVGWDNNNYLKDLTRRYVPQWNTVTRKQRVEPLWWDKAIKPWLGPKTPRDREEDESLDRMQLDAPLPKSIAEYKNHPLYALKRHLLKFEAIYPPDAATLGFVRGEPVYARDCVYVCRSRDTWLKEAKVVRLGEKPYKVVKARPKWDKLSNKLITDKPLEVFGPWQVQDYEPPIAENGIVPRNAYGNVELFKECMLPKGTVHIKLPGLNRVAKKLNIDCAPAMTGFDFNGGWSHPVFEGFVVCKEFEEIIINAWQEDQEEQERKEQEKMETRVYGNWKRLIKGLLIKERLKVKYGFTEPTTSKDSKKKSTGPRLTVKKKL